MSPEPRRKAAGEQVDSKRIKKHRADIFRLVDLVPSEGAYKLPDLIRQDVESFLDIVERDRNFDPKSIDLKFSLDEGIAILRRAYGVEAS